MAQFSSNVTSDMAFLPWAGYGFGGILSTLNKRIPFLQSHPEISLDPPDIGPIQLTDSILTVEVLNADTVEIMISTVSAFRTSTVRMLSVS